MVSPGGEDLTGRPEFHEVSSKAPSIQTKFQGAAYGTAQDSGAWMRCWHWLLCTPPQYHVVLLLPHLLYTFE